MFRYHILTARRKFEEKSLEYRGKLPHVLQRRVYVLNISHDRKRRHSVLIRFRVPASGPSFTTPWARLNALFWRSLVSAVNTPVVIQQVQLLARLIFKLAHLENRRASTARNRSISIPICFYRYYKILQEQSLFLFQYLDGNILF